MSGLGMLETNMTDLFYLALGLVWFALTAGFIRLCDRLMPPDRGSKP